jgi:hypothetical protein
MHPMPGNRCAPRSHADDPQMVEAGLVTLTKGSATTGFVAVDVSDPQCARAV